MIKGALQIHTELGRLMKSPELADKPGGVGTVRFIAPCPLDAKRVLERVISVLKIIDETSLTDWLSYEQWAVKLPEWFILAFAAPMTEQQAEQWLVRWRRLSADEQARAESEADWSLDNWLYWMRPENRQWFWWDAKILEDGEHIIVAVEVEAWPFPWASLRWLFKAAGASTLEPEE